MANGRVVLFGLVAAAMVQTAWAGTVPSLDQVRSEMKTPAGRATFDKEIAGKPQPDTLGVHLPADLSAAQITGLLWPAGKALPPDATVGAKPLPGQAGIYVAIVANGAEAHLGEIEAKAGAALRLIAKPAILSTTIDWDHSWLPNNGDDLTDDWFSVEGFDLAPYLIASGQRAFGLRGSWNIGYAGGGSTYTGLYLFAVVDGSLKQIVALPMAVSIDIAGDWHKDGTRDHDVSDGENVLMVSKTSTNGYFDLMLKNRTGADHQTYRWSAASAAYAPAP